MKGKVKSLAGNWSRAKYLVHHYCHSLFSLFLNFPSFLYSLPFLMLSRPPEGSTLERCENQSLTPFRPAHFHLVMMCFLECRLVGLSTFLLCSAFFSIWETYFHSLLQQITHYFLNVKGANENQLAFSVPISSNEHVIAWRMEYKLSRV